MRADLLALTADDLTALSNRGLTRRAQQEASSQTLSCTIAEGADGTVTVRWSDNVECRLPANARLSDSRCTCPSTTLCRHILRSIFAYQHKHRAESNVENVTTARSSPPSAPWSPATISDAQLATHFSPAEIARWQREYSAGHVIHVWTGTKPRAHIHSLGCTINFLVPHDPRYAVCDCADETPCGHVLLSVWAFRQLDSGATAGLIATASTTPSVPVALLDDIEHELLSLAQSGLARTAALQVDRWRRLATRARDERLVWPAEVLDEIAAAHAAYLAHDARFDSREFAALIAELLQRVDAIRTARTPVPQLFVRGATQDRETDFGSARLIGIGCGVHISRTSTELAAYQQDSDSGAITAITRRFPHEIDPSGAIVAPHKPFAELARSVVLKGVSLEAIGRGQLLVKGGRRSPSGRFVPGRAAASVAPQTYAWESLRAPLRATEFAEVSERLRDAPPASLGPRHVGARLAVCPIATVDEVRFDVARQETLARLTDQAGNVAWLVHPYTSRGAIGSQALLHALRTHSADIRFVCGRVRLEGAKLVIEPLSVVLEENGRRTCIQPWIEENPPPRSEIDESRQDSRAFGYVDPLHDYLDELLDCVAERWLTGQVTSPSAMSRLASLGTSLGLTHLADLTRFDEPAGLLEMTVIADFAFREFARLGE